MFGFWHQIVLRNAKYFQLIDSMENTANCNKSYRLSVVQHKGTSSNHFCLCHLTNWFEMWFHEIVCICDVYILKCLQMRCRERSAHEFLWCETIWLRAIDESKGENRWNDFLFFWRTSKAKFQFKLQINYLLESSQTNCSNGISCANLTYYCVLT